MKQGQLAEIKDLLLDLRRQLLNTIDDVGGSAETVELDQAMVGRLSRMDAMQHQEMAKAQKRRATLRLQRVEFCLQQLAGNDDRFGQCADCLEPISYPRLRELPDSEYCVACLQEQARA